jgi:multidrug resistance efflux pump
MGLILDIAIALGAFVAAAYCMVLSRRLRALSQLDGDVGAAIAVLSQQVDALTRALQSASKAGTQAEASLALTIARAETTTRNLELMLAAGRAAPQGTAEADFVPLSRNSARTRVTRQGRDPELGRP